MCLLVSIKRFRKRNLSNKIIFPTKIILKKSQKILVREHLQYPKRRYITPLNVNLTEVFAAIKGKDFVQYPPFIIMSPYTRNSKNILFIHKDKRRDIEDCFMLKKEIERLVAKGYIK